MIGDDRQRAQKRIESARNPLVRELRLLEKDRGARSRAGLYIAWGVHLAQEALLARAPIRSAWVGPALDRTAEGRRLAAALKGRCGSIVRTTNRLLDSIVPGAGDQGVLLLVEGSRRTADDLVDAGANLLLVMHGVQDPGNLGSIVRTADTLGADGLLVLEGCADPYSSRAVRAAMGAQFRIAISPGDAADVLRSLARAGLQIVASHVQHGVPPAAVDLRRPSALFVGSEGAGLPSGIIEHAEKVVRIRMAAGSASLNVHAAATILLYEAARQRQEPVSG